MEEQNRMKKKKVVINYEDKRMDTTHLI